MALLTDPQKAEVYKEIIQKFGDRHELLSGIKKQDIKDAITNTDQFQEDNKAAFNNVLPTAVKNNLAAKAKAELFMIVADAKYKSQ